MLRINRSRFIGIACLLIFIYFVVFTDTGSATSSEFRTSTEAGLAKARSKHNLPLRGDLSDEDLTKKTYEELQGILNSQSKESAKKDADGNVIGRTGREGASNGVKEEPKRKGEDDGKKYVHEVKSTAVSQEEEDPVAASRKAMQQTEVPARKPLSYHEAEKPLNREKSSKDGGADGDADSDKDYGKEFTREKLTEYLRHPVVIFSKTYCPHSKRAKQLLLEVYNINPKPIVVELDMLGEKVPQSADPNDESHISLGQSLQYLLGEITGRKTVPNVMVGGSHSIGGNDKIWELHESGLLAEEIRKLGGRKIVSVDVHDSEDDGQR